MTSTWCQVLKTLLVVGIPAAGLLAGFYFFGQLPERQAIERRIGNGVKSLNQRYLGYNADDAQKYWQLLSGSHAAKRDDLRPNERYMLRLDLAFPFVYGGAFAIALLLAWSSSQWSFNPVWLLLPVFVMVCADWTENLVQLSQLSRLNEYGEGQLSRLWIGIASTATVLKLATVGICSLLVIGSAGYMVTRLFVRSP